MAFNDLENRIRKDLLAINELTEADDTTLHDAIMTLIEMYESGGGRTDAEVDTSAIVEWYKSSVQSAVNYVAKLGNKKWVHHVMLADTHYGRSNSMHSLDIVKALLDTGRFDKFIHTGDLFGDGATDKNVGSISDYVGYLNGKTMYVYGAHDFIPSGATIATPSWYYDNLMSKANWATWGTDDHSTLNNLYYTYDDEIHHIRYVCPNLKMNTSTTDAHAQWLINQIDTCPDDWILIVVNHLEAFSSNLAKKAHAAIAMNKSYCGGWIMGAHRDTRHDYGMMTEIWTLLDECNGGNDSSGGDSPTSENRVLGTVSENAITIVSINHVNKKVQTYRIGAYGSNYADTFPIIQSYNMTENGRGGWTAGGISTTGIEVLQTGTNELLEKFIAIDKTKPIYIYANGGSWRNGSNSIQYGFYTEDKSGAFSTGTRVADKGEELYAYVTCANPKGNTTNDFVAIACENIGDDKDKLIITQDPLEIVIPFESVGWKNAYIASGGGSFTNSDNDRAKISYFSVKPNTKYVLEGTEGSASCLVAYRSVLNRSAGNIGRFSVNSKNESGLLTFTTPTDAYFAMFSIGYTENYDKIRLIEAAV